MVIQYTRIRDNVSTTKISIDESTTEIQMSILKIKRPRLLCLLLVVVVVVYESARRRQSETTHAINVAHRAPRIVKRIARTCNPLEIIRFTAFPPPPPHPMTLIFAALARTSTPARRATRVFVRVRAHRASRVANPWIVECRNDADTVDIGIAWRRLRTHRRPTDRRARARRFASAPTRASVRGHGRHRCACATRWRCERDALSDGCGDKTRRKTCAF